jgi:WD40 repeat protein
MWDMRMTDKGPKQILAGHNKMVTCLKWDWTKIFSGSKDHTVKIWDSNTGTLIKSKKLFKDNVSCVDFDDTRLISASWDGTVNISNTGE